MFNIKNGVISLNKTRRLSPRQVNQLNRLGTESDKNRYMLSIMGLVKRQKVYVDRLKMGGTDALASKRQGSIAKLMRELRDVDTDHRPSTKNLGQWVGVEIECLIPHREGHGDCECEFNDDGDREYECNSCANGNNWSEDDAHSWLRDKLTAAGVSRVQVKSDGSVCDDSGHGVECTILFDSSHGFEPLHRLCNALHKAGCYVNKSCGLHVHLDARHLKAKQVKKIGQSLGHALPVIKYLVDKSRHNNNYCQMQVSGMGRRADRYCAVNMTAFEKYKTIEIRLHGGSINPVKITHWVNLLKIIGASKLKSSLMSFQDLIDLSGVTESMIEYMERRINRLNPEAWLNLTPHEFSAWPRAVAPLGPIAHTPIVPVNVTPEQFEAIITQVVDANRAELNQRQGA